MRLLVVLICILSGSLVRAVTVDELPARGSYRVASLRVEGADQVFAARFRMGGGDAFGQSKDLPLFRRFFAGGINSTRGYDRHKLGPLTSQEDHIGGAA